MICFYGNEGEEKLLPLFPLKVCGDETCISVIIGFPPIVPLKKGKELASEPHHDAVVPHNLVEFSISFKLFSGLPATMKGHVCGGKRNQLERACYSHKFNRNQNPKLICVELPAGKHKKNHNKHQFFWIKHSY